VEFYFDWWSAVGSVGGALKAHKASEENVEKFVLCKYVQGFLKGFCVHSR
jgi:hypothetical protein